VIAGRFFITSEQFEASDGTRAPRMYTVRVANDDGSVDEISKFQAFDNLRAARRWAEHHARPAVL
jgi:hypothetical protein